MKCAPVLVVLVAVGMFLIAGCATDDEPPAPTSSAGYSSPTYSPSSPASTAASASAASPAPVTETVAPPPVATQTPTVPAPTQDSGLPPYLDRDGDGILDEGAVGGGDTDEALCNDPNLADWAATSPTCQ